MSETTDGALAASVHARCEQKYAIETAIRHHRVQADEPAAKGGGDTAPTPMEALAAALAGCTAITLRMYAERKGWELGTVKVDVRAYVDGPGYRFERSVKISAPLGDDEKGRLLEIADKTPVTKAVKAGSPVVTKLG
jgi:putative redox protein